MLDKLRDAADFGIGLVLCWILGVLLFAVFAVVFAAAFTILFGALNAEFML